jgi:ribosome-binding protein aMBF1 (putative translation factor)
MSKYIVFKSPKEMGKALGFNEYDLWIRNYKMNLQLLIIKTRKQKKMSQIDLAKKLKTTQSVISRVEKGFTKSTSIEYFLKILFVLGVEPKQTLKSFG